MSSDALPVHDPPRERRNVDSLLIVNTGDGKGKSTAAFGTLMRSVAQKHGTRVTVDIVD